MRKQKLPMRTINDINVKIVKNKDSPYAYVDVDDIAELSKTIVKENTEVLKREGLRAIHPAVHAYYNSINLFVGRQGTGKTHTAMNEIAKISRVSPQTCLIVYVTKSGEACDDTVEKLKDLCLIDIAYVKEDDAEIYVKNLQEYLNFYKDIKDNHWEDKLDDFQRDEVLDALHIDDFSTPFLHVIILFEDFANNQLVKKPDSFFSQFIATLRHRGFSVFMCVQFWKSLPTTIKSNVALIYLFAGYSREQFSYITRQIPGEYDKNDLSMSYYQLKGNERLVINTITQQVTFDRK
jgi:hypothetical protein